MKDWQEVVRLYEKDNVYLAEASQILMRNVAYEIPGTKKSIAKCEQVQHVSHTCSTLTQLFLYLTFVLFQECDKKEAECTKHAQEFRDKYKSLCNQMGIEGKNIKKELCDLLSSLPQMYKDVAKQMKQLKEAAAYYQSFVGQMISTSSGESCLPVLQYIIGSVDAIKVERFFLKLTIPI